MLTYKSLNIGQPEHLSVLLSDYTPSRQLRSSDHQLLSQPTDNTVFAGCAFSSTAPRIWNSLPITIRTASTFRRHLKTAPTIRTSVLTYGALQMQTTYLLTYLCAQDRCTWSVVSANAARNQLATSSSSSSTTVGSMPVGVWRHSYYRCPPLPI